MKYPKLELKEALYLKKTGKKASTAFIKKILKLIKNKKILK